MNRHSERSEMSRLLFALCFSSYLYVLISSVNVAPSEEKFAPKLGKHGQNQDGTEIWGYVDVRPQAHMFYWLYHTYHPDGIEQRPLILWLQGGPGGSSCGYGNFDIIGPLKIDLTERNTTWVKQASVLFIDNPVGAGYSYVDNLDALTRTGEEITEDLLTALKVILDVSPKFKTVPFYIFGQSYGGKMGASLARRLHDEILVGTIQMRLMGFAMGNAWISPIDSTLTWAPLLYWMSLTDAEGEALIMEEARKAEAAIEAGNWELATGYWASTEWAVINQTNGVDFYNILKFVNYFRLHNVDEFRLGLKYSNHNLYRTLFPPSQGRLADDPLDELMNGPIRIKLGIPDHVIWGSQSGAVFTYQEGDFMKPVVETVDKALKETALEVIIYQGQLDLICDTKGAMDFVQQFTWNLLPNYNQAARRAFTDPRDGQTNMFVKSFGRFKFYWVLDAGHAVPKDNGDAAFVMLERILGNMDQ